MREVVVDEQVRRLAALPLSRIAIEASRDENRPEVRVREEALVAVCRLLAGRGQTDAAWRIALILAARVKHRIAHALRFWRLDQPDSVARDVADEVITALYAAVFDDGPKSRFWEIRFWVAFDRRLLTAIRTKRMEVDRTLDLVFAGDDADDDGDEAALVIAPGVAEERAGSLSDPLMNALVVEALATLPERARTAYILKYAVGMPEDSSRADGPLTIASVLGVTGRSVRNYLRRAELAIERWRGDTSEEDGTGQ
jgi:DNA-directed RNA polymerase specialized sigma24 family protein